MTRTSSVLLFTGPISLICHFCYTYFIIVFTYIYNKSTYNLFASGLQKENCTRKNWRKTDIIHSHSMIFTLSTRYYLSVLHYIHTIYRYSSVTFSSVATVNAWGLLRKVLDEPNGSAFHNLMRTSNYKDNEDVILL